MRLVSKISVKELNTKIRLAHSDSKKIDYFYRRFVATESFSLKRAPFTLQTWKMVNHHHVSRSVA